MIKPSKKSIQKHYSQLADIINASKSLKQESLIGKLNPVIRGWCNYYRTVISSEIFYKLARLVIWKLFKWGIKRHTNKGRKWIKNRYFHSFNYISNNHGKLVSKDWNFATTTDGQINLSLYCHGETKIVRHVKVKGNSSPYDGNLIYWSTRMGRNPIMPITKAKLLKRQKGKCNWCELTFRHGDILETDHITPKSKGGNNTYKNLQLLHRHCHDEKTRIDGSNDNSFKPVKLPYGWFWKEGMLIT